ncbi:MAG: phosphatidylglycerol lysyltransferase domain-containing protein [Desulfotomaculales bacterium]
MRKSLSVPQACAVFIALNGALNILSAWLIHHPERIAVLKKILPAVVIQGSWLTAVVAGSIQLFLSFSLGRRKLLAWRLAVGVLLLAAVTSLLRGLHYGQAAVNLCLLLLLLVSRRHFTAASDPPSIRHGLFIALGTLVFTYLYGVTGFYLLDRHFHEHFDLAESSRQTLAFLAWVSTPEVAHPTRVAKWFLNSFAFLEAGGLAYALAMILRPVVYRRRVLPAERRRAAAILEQYGKSSLAFLTLLPDKFYFFSRSGQSFAAYTLVGNVAVVLGDPVGPDGDIPRLVAQFKTLCEKNDWHPVFYQVLPDYLPVYRDLGFKFLKIGEEAVVDVRDFSLSGSARKSLRWSVNRMLRKGYTTKMFFPPLADETLKELKDVSEEWLKLQHGGEKRFSLGWFDPHYLRQCPVMAVVDPEGKIQAFANLIPEYRRNEGTVDLMRRRGEDSGLMDLLFVRLIKYFREQGYATFNLGLAPLAGVGDYPEAGVPEKVLNFFYQHFNQLYAFKGLRRFKEKFGPRWEPRYLVYTSPLLLPKIALAITTANAGGNLFFTYVGAWWKKRRKK